MTDNLLTLPVVNCDCPECQEMCYRPCWPTPDEAQSLINSGLGDKLMLDYWVNIGRSDTFVLCPANKNRTGGVADFVPTKHRCVFQDENTLKCELHNSDMKPLEGRVVSCQEGPNNMHERIKELWDTDDAKKLVDNWRRNFME